MSEMGVSALRLPNEIEKAIEERTKEEKIDKSAAMKQFLIAGIKEYKKQKAIELYREGKVSLSDATKAASVNIYEVIDLLIKAGIKSDYSLEDMRTKRKTLEKLMRK